jgi:hypothetical protein
MCVAAVAVGGRAMSQEASPAPRRLAAGPEARFGGYLYLDADGRPLPFQSDEEIEHFLATAEILSSTKIPVGVTAPKKVLLEADGVRANAAFKNVDLKENKVRERVAGKTRFYLEWRDWYGYDIAAYRVDRLLGLDRVPPVIERTWRRHTGSVQIWLEGVITDADRHEQGIEPPDPIRWNQQKAILRVFDNLVANRDSNLGNMLIDQNWRTWFIDCSRCFGNSTDLLSAEALTHCERSLWNELQHLERERATASLDPYLSSQEIDALFVRRDKLVAHIQELIDTWGEGMILFDASAPADQVHPDGG